ncbi:MAG: hypothetical protein JKY54_06985 [Flavobacteriales bacterium]|nr:hypothetical protein [Flavobacteriales bacterium]
MKQTIVIIITLFTFQSGYSQINPIGLLLNLNGTIEVHTGPPNYNGRLDNPVYVICDTDTVIWDLRNVRYDQLTIIEAPKYIYPSNLDPSYEEYENTLDFDFTNSTIPIYGEDSGLIIFNNDSAVFSANKTNRFRDEIIGVGMINNANIQLMKTKLSNHIKHYLGNSTDEEDLQRIYYELSTPDSIVDGEMRYDYLIDKLIFYNYEANKLTSIMGYHWNYGVEFDSLKYDSFGSLIYFLREEVGSLRDEIFLSYDKKNRVTGMIRTYGYADSSPSITESKFTYDLNGILNSKSTRTENGSWEICEIKLKNSPTGR